MTELLKKLYLLKDLKRQGWLDKDVPNPESVSDHSFMTAMLALLLAKECGYDECKCIKMALLHDTAESIIGDITPKDEKRVIKEELEAKANKELFGDSEAAKLCEEYASRKTPEAKFVCELDKLELFLQGKIYQGKYQKDVSELMDYAKLHLKNKVLLEIADLA
jgi:putative hydrolases of HD superfamily